MPFLLYGKLFAVFRQLPASSNALAKFLNVTIHSRSKHHAKNLPASCQVSAPLRSVLNKRHKALSTTAKTAAFVFVMMFRTAYMLISENNHPLTCKHDEFEYFLEPAVNSNY